MGKENFTCINRTNSTKILSSTPDHYRKIVKYLDSTSAQFHTYQLQEERALRVVIRNLHPSTPTDEIKAELQDLGFAIRQVVNAKRNENGEVRQLPLFFVDLERNQNSEKIYELTRLYHTKISVESLHRKKDIVQCTKCQKYGHTKSYCRHQPRCVKCGSSHTSDACTKSRDSPATCALCHLNHPANYKGCQTYQSLRARIRPARQPTQQPYRPPRTVSSELSYAMAAGTHRTNQSPAPRVQFAVQEEPQTHTSHQRQDAPSSHSSRPQTSHVPPPNSSSDITSLLTTFLSELQSLITPLISLLTQIVPLLIPAINKK